jgi:hypothetical protein
MIILGKVYQRGKRRLLGVFKAVLGVSACITKTPWAHAGACMRAGAGGRGRAGVRVCVRVCAHTHIEKTPPLPKN